VDARRRGHDYYFRQLSDMKMTIDVEHMSKQDWDRIRWLCGWAWQGRTLEPGMGADPLVTSEKTTHSIRQSRNSLLRMADQN